MPLTKDQITGVVLAGGKSSRMLFNDKALLPLGGKRIVDYVIECARPQVGRLIVNANRNLEQFQALGLPVVPDSYGADAGPLAGILRAMQWCRCNSPETRAIACFPVDAPWFPVNNVSLLSAAFDHETARVVWLSNDGQWQPLFSLWSLELEAVLQLAITEGIYSPMALIRSLPNREVAMNECPPGQFQNLNTPEDLLRAQALLVAHRSED